MKSFLRHIYTPISAKKRRGRASAIMPLPTRAPAQGKKGVALIMVMVVTTVLSAIAADLSNAAQVNLRAAANAKDELQAHFHARSALELELFVLRFQSLVKGTLGNFIPVPLFELSGFLVSSDTIKGIIDRDGDPEDNAKKESFALSTPQGDFDGSFWIEEVVDENRKINLNSEGFGTGCQNYLPLLMAAVFDDPKYDLLFESMGDSRDPIRNRLEVIANIIDWTDANRTVDPLCILTQDQSVSGPEEDTRYNNLPRGAQYKPKNGMMNSLAELRLVPLINDAFMRIFSKYFTIWGSNGISMQTADPWMYRVVIRAISPQPAQLGDEERFQKFMQERALMMAMPPPLNKMSMPVFTQLLQSAQIPYDPQRLQLLEQKQFIRFDDISTTYRITAIGRVNDASSKITVIWRDNRAQGEMYYWREE